MTTALILAAALLQGTGAPLKVEDSFGRPLEGHGLVLVDWEGYIANPATRFSIVPPANATYPVRVVVRSGESRLYFDSPSQAGPSGSSKEVLLAEPERLSVSISIFPDRDGRDEDHALEVALTDASGETYSRLLPIHVVDQDHERPETFAITLDFSQDRTGFFEDPAKRAVAIRAAHDWAYFFDGDGLEPVCAGAEATSIWNPDGFHSIRMVTNASAYAGYLLYPYGIDSPLERSGGEPSRFGGFQAKRGQSLRIRRSGGYQSEVKGNYNREGWLVGVGDSQWWQATNLRGVKSDLESIADHEIGHELIFNEANPRFAAAKLLGKLQDDRVRAYLGSDPAIDQTDHLAGTIDPASLHGAFGNEYHGRTPYGRWLITKLDLLCAQAVGYPLRETSAFVPLTLLPDSLPDGNVSVLYTATLRAQGGVPCYHWEVLEGPLPDGLSLDPFTGALRGTPTQLGESEFTARVREFSDQGQTRTRRFRLRITD